MNKIIFINYSNHPYEKWSIEQKDAVAALAANYPDRKLEVMDIPFPNIHPAANTGQIATQAMLQTEEFEKLSLDNKVILHIMGEMTYVYNVVKRCERMEIICVASTTERLSVENPDGSKTVKFQFKQFRQY